MPTAHDETDPVDTADKRRIMWIGLAAVLLPVALMLIGSTHHPELAYVLVALLFPALWIVGTIRGRRTREGTDERARELHRRSATFSWQVMVVVLTATMAWMDVRHGIRAAEPYLVLVAGLVVSYVAALLWNRRRR